MVQSQSPDGGEGAVAVTSDGTKKKKLSNLEKGDGRRLVEYLLVVSSIQMDPNEELDAHAQELKLDTNYDDEEVEVIHEFKPQITARYPLHDHQDNPLVDNISVFCHPSGAINLKKDPYMPKVRINTRKCHPTVT